MTNNNFKKTSHLVLKRTEAAKLFSGMREILEILEAAQRSYDDKSVREELLATATPRSRLPSTFPYDLPLPSSVDSLPPNHSKRSPFVVVTDSFTPPGGAERKAKVLKSL